MFIAAHDLIEKFELNIIALCGQQGYLSNRKDRLLADRPNEANNLTPFCPLPRFLPCFAGNVPVITVSW